jgi:hypothetical protein
MSFVDHRQFGTALESIEKAILPSLSHLLDDTLDSAALARPGIDAEQHSARLRRSANQVSRLARLVAAVAPHAQRGSAPRIAA